MTRIDIETKYLTPKLENLDELLESKHLTEAEYIQIGLLLKITEILNNIQNGMSLKR